MRLSTLRIQNFRSFFDETIDFSPYTCFVGTNGSGKSTVLNALNVLFRESANSATDLQVLGKEDFHNGDVSQPIRITATFESLSQEARADFAAYLRHDKLTIVAKAEWDQASESAQVLQHGSRLAMRAFVNFFKSEEMGEKVEALKAQYEILRQDHPELPVAKTKQAMLEALRQYETSHPSECEDIESSNQFYGWSKGANLLQKYIQWVFVPGVKDASQEQSEGRSTALGKLLERTVRSQVSFSESLKTIRDTAATQYGLALEAQNAQLEDISQRLQTSVRQFANSSVGIKLVWHQDPLKAVSVAEPFATIRASESSFVTSLSRMGHGLQRSYMLALLQELARSDAQDQPMLLLGCEEPELYQHPAQTRRLTRVLAKMAKDGNACVVLCTHSPHFVSVSEFEEVRLVAPPSATAATRVRKATHDGIADVYRRAYPTRSPINRGGAMQRLSRSMNTTLNEMFFCRSLVLVEGIEDVAFLQHWIELTGREEAHRAAGCHIVPCGLKSFMPEPLAIANQLQIPTMAVFDLDLDAEAKYRRSHDEDNAAIMTILGHTPECISTDDLQLGSNYAAWRTNISDAIRDDFGKEVWVQAQQVVLRDQYINGSRLGKCPLLIAYVLTQLHNDGARSAKLDRVCEQVLNHAARG